MSLIFLAGLTPAGYGFIGVFLLSFLFANILMNPSDKEEKSGCVAIGFVALIISFVLMFPFSISFGILENGPTEARIAVVVFWVLVLATVVYVGITKSQAGFKRGFFKVLKILFFAIGLALFVVMFFGLAYFVYQRIYTHDRDDAPVWAVLLSIFFVATLILVAFGLLSGNKDAKKKEKTTFYDLEAAKLKPESVVELNLSNTKINVFPVVILQFRNIKFLALNNNNISEIPNEISQLQLIMGIDLSNNPISDLERNKIRKLLSKEVEIVF
jgi:hypothetical protein